MLRTASSNSKVSSSAPGQQSAVVMERHSYLLLKKKSTSFREINMDREEIYSKLISLMQILQFVIQLRNCIHYGRGQCCRGIVITSWIILSLTNGHILDFPIHCI
mmetsp:Transcript_33929/g.57611  ORF Transcript_33929/g.57611 Transcript_33929/m.57611 type:complete len:105 (+) Transcript_33929:97-411(+)